MTPEAPSKVCSPVEGTTRRWGEPLKKQVRGPQTLSLPTCPRWGWVGAGANQERGHLVAIFVHSLSTWFASFISCGSSRSLVLVLGKQN